MEKGDIVPFGRPPPKRVKRGHLSSDYRQKCVNATRDILMSKARKMTILTITMFNENVHTGCLFLNGKKSRHSLNGWGGGLLVRFPY